ncbi:intradiol ring-cleavage dioxygenase [Roseivirga sp. 4D4]|uniref:dioxygenase family protein n=1 Tax=Roseivirga sp. 4D4 TaxID=1889784 RepID=UPI000853C79A|nr:intradiol ring-cleavage dioxygenase [Roseivirga sp. 4D4]OEK01332.1 intradiol ring-cleavage dioxygenase [Roseivirga sp. 4D4]
MVKSFTLSLLLFISVFSCNAFQSKKVGGPFENAEFMYFGMPENIASSDTTLGWFGKGQKLIITGKILKADGKTPAPNVIVYYYHTDTEGHYSSRKDMDQRAARHGHLRGWVKSDAEGKYAIYTIRPAAYPNRSDPAHIHPTILEPQINTPYYTDALVFDDDILLTTAKRKAMDNRAGSGILRVLMKGDIQIAEHNFILGLNIPNYPKKESPEINSGRSIGEDLFSFTPYHAWGPDMGTTTCPICKYGRYQGVLYFAGANTDWMEVKAWLRYLEAESFKRQEYLKTFFICTAKEREEVNAKLVRIGKELGLRKVSLTTVPSYADRESEVYLNEINPLANNTFIIYRNSNVVAKFIELSPTESNYKLMSEALDNTKGDYMHLAPPRHK